MIKNIKIIIVGAGISGLTMAYELLKKGYSVTVLEKEHEIGGLARSFNYKGMIFDIGPHRFFSNDIEITGYIKDILKDGFVNISRSSAVFFDQKYYRWPLNFISVSKMNVKILLKVFRDLLFLKNKNTSNYKEYIENKYGKTLYEIFFKSYTEKFFAVKADILHSVWAEESINRAVIVKKTNNILGLLTYFIKNNFIKEKKFIYPLYGGIAAYCKNIALKINELKGEIYTDKIISKINISGGKIESLECGDKTVYNPDIIIWTAPVTDLASLLNIESNLKYRNMIIFNIVINKSNKAASKYKYQWCYFGDSKLALNRFSIPSLFSPNNADDLHDSICVEVSCSSSDDIWKAPDSFKDIILNELIQIKAISDKNDVCNVYTEKIENVYPVYDLAYKDNLSSLIKKISAVKNIRLAGRSGLFWYNNMDDSIHNALSVAGKIHENCSNS